MFKKVVEKFGFVDMSEILTPKAKQEIKKGHTLGFKQEDGSFHHYVITHVNKKSNKFYAKRLPKLYSEEEVQELAKSYVESK